MHQDEWAADAAMTTEDGKTWSLRYYVRVITAETETPVYGVKIDKYAINGDLTETKATPGLTTLFAEAQALALRFARGTVTPSVLLEMADEWAS